MAKKAAGPTMKMPTPPAGMQVKKMKIKLMAKPKAKGMC